MKKIHIFFKTTSSTGKFLNSIKELENFIRNNIIKRLGAKNYKLSIKINL